MVVAAGQPLITDDLWLHLALGQLYSEHGPDLAREPFLHTAQAPPPAHAWLADRALHAVVEVGDFVGLRVLHGATVAFFLGFAAWIARRETRSLTAAALCASALTLFSAYRLVQLRPHLFTMIAVLILYAFFLREPSRPRGWKYAAVAVLSAIWANVHAAFVLGPLLILAALAGVGVTLLLEERSIDPVLQSPRVRRLAGYAIAAIVGACINPDGIDRLMLYFAAGGETASLESVADEWGGFPLSGWPGGNLPPTPAVWVGCVLLFVTVPLTGLRSLGVACRSRNGGDVEPSSSMRIDPALLAIAAASLVGMALAVRFIWLAFFPILVLFCEARRRAMASAGESGAQRARRFLALALALMIGFYSAGPWSIVGQFTSAGARGYSSDYPPQRYFGHAVWFLADTELTGNLFNPYFMGNFLAYWLSPRLRVFSNGSLRVSDEVLANGRDLVARRTNSEGLSFEEQLDLAGIDLFVGIGLPDVPRSRRPWHYSTTHLESQSGWVLLFRNLDSAVYLRRGERNAKNLDRVVDYYRRSGVPFDPQRGFDPARVIGAAPSWAIRNGIVPIDFPALDRSRSSPSATNHNRIASRLATLFVALGRYADALEIDRARPANERDLRTQRRIVWALLQAGDFPAAMQEAERLAAVARSTDRLSLGIVDTARAAASDPQADERRRVARLPLFDRAEVEALVRGMAPPSVRPARRDWPSGSSSRP